MVGEQANNTMAKNKELKEQLAELAATEVTATDAATTEQEIQDSEVSLSGRVLPVGAVVSHVTKSNGRSANLLRIDLVALQGHRVNDTVSIIGQGDVMVSASFGKMKVQPKNENADLRDKHRMKLLAEAEAAFIAEDFGKAKTLYAEVDAMSKGEIDVVKHSGKDSFDIDLDKGFIVGDKFRYAKSTKDDPLIWVNGVAHRLRYTIQRALLKNEKEKPTERQKTRAADREAKKAQNAALLAAIKLQGQREYQILLAEQRKNS